MRDLIKLGDTVRAIGRYEHVDSAGGHDDGNVSTFIVREIHVLIRWRDLNPATAFVPRPAPNPRVNGDITTVVAVSVASTATAEATAAVAATNADGSIVNDTIFAFTVACNASSTATDGAGTATVFSSDAQAAEKTAAAATTASSSSRTKGVVCQNVERDVEGDNGTIALSKAPVPAVSCADAAPAADGCGPLAVSELRDEGKPAGIADISCGSGIRPMVCKYWAATGRCPKGGGIYSGSGICQYDHPPERGGASGVQQLYVRSRRSERLATASELGFVHETGDAAKRHRAAVFCEWLVQTYGREFLNSGAGVVDVAGGRGALTFHLLLRCGVRATLVEPRPAKWSRSQHREIQLVAAAAAMPPLAPGELTLPQLRRRFEPALWRRDTSGVGGDSGRDGEDEEENLRELLLGCSMVVGLHPDQATEAILDFALECGKPFALVPCCVFPRLFPNRRLLLLPPLPAPSTRPLPLQKREGAEPEDLHAQPFVFTSPSKPQLPPAPPFTSSNSSASAAPVADSSSARWVPVETYSQFLSYLLQRAQLYGRWDNSTCREGSGGGGGHRGSPYPLSMTPLRRHQEVWLQLWRLATGASNQGKLPSPDRIRSRGPRPALKHYPGPNQIPDSRPDSDSNLESNVEHDGNLEGPLELPSDYRQQLVSGQAPPRSSCKFTLLWLEHQVGQWERDGGVGPGAVTAATVTEITTATTVVAAADAGMKRSGHAKPEAYLNTAASAATSAAVRAAGTAGTGNMAPLRYCRGNSGVERGAYLDVNATGAKGAIDNAGCGKPDPGRSPGFGEAAIIRLAFQGANQVLYRLPSVQVNVMS
ncbi:hypothetical protein Vretimale_16270 [Volvox reticuliferus]|nr:hypothetical protein Vretimale_16270 [Volvox reticuliferus]